MSLGQRVIDAIEGRRDRKRRARPGPIGDFWRDGGNAMLYDVAVQTGHLVIDAGGYKGEWTAGMLTRYGCRSHLYEPIPQFAAHCRTLFEKNRLVTVELAALGGSNRTTTFGVLDDATTEFVDAGQAIEATVVDVATVFGALNEERVACLKLNIEGGEYEVLERLLETGQIDRCDALLVQFHRQPPGYDARYHAISEALARTHSRTWSYEFVWEKWVINGVLR